jgi:hypothetical protein
MQRRLFLLPLVTLLACGEASVFAPDTGSNETASESTGPRIIFRVRPGRFLCGLPPDENGNTCRFVPDDGSDIVDGSPP